MFDCDIYRDLRVQYSDFFMVLTLSRPFRPRTAREAEFFFKCYRKRQAMGVTGGLRPFRSLAIPA
jgi:hypothetical protein